jgi:hypothetical protein
MSLENLKVQSAPKALAQTAILHNAVVDLLSNIRGENGIEVLVTEGGILIRGAGTTSGGSGLTQAEFNAFLDALLSSGGGATYDHLWDWVIERFGQETIDVCGLGSITFPTVV